jgi:hypothetical protein
LPHKLCKVVARVAGRKNLQLDIPRVPQIIFIVQVP